MKRVLSLDGGGIRGLIPAMVCQKIEELSKTSIHQLFDLIAGTSTGGIITMGLALPPQGKPARELVNFFKEDGVKIFSRPRGVGRYLRGSKYKSSNLEEVVTKYFGGVKISEAIVDIFVTTYDIQHRKPLYISRSRAKEDETNDYLMREVAMGTSAAPTYFPPAILQDPTRHQEPTGSQGAHIVIDGGMVANNPACLAYAEAKQLWPDEEILLVSLGTGTLTDSYFFKKAAKWGTIRWTKPLIDCFFDGTAKAADDFLRNMLGGRRYWRFQANLSECTEHLDGISEKSIFGLQQIGQSIIDGQQYDLSQLCDELQQAPTQSEFRNIVLITPAVSNFFNQIVGAIAVSSHKERKHLIVKVPHRDYAESGQTMIIGQIMEGHVQCEAMIIVPINPKSLQEQLSKLKKVKMPIISFDIQLGKIVDKNGNSWTVPFVGVDNKSGGAKAAQFFINYFNSLGVSKPHVEILSGPGGLQTGIYEWRERIKGFKEEWEKLNSNKKITPDLITKVEKWDRTHGQELALEILRERGEIIDGIFCCNDDIAIGVRNAILTAKKDRWIRPDKKIRIVGFDCIDEARYLIDSEDDYMIASIDVKIGDQLRYLMEEMKKLIAGQKACIEHLVEPVVYSRLI